MGLERAELSSGRMVYAGITFVIVLGRQTGPIHDSKNNKETCKILKWKKYSQITDLNFPETNYSNIYQNTMPFSIQG